MLTRAEFSFDFEIKSDSASVWPLVERLLTLGPDLRFLRDPTRGGIAATLNELAQASGKGVLVHETAIPIDEGVRAASEILGIDPLQAANEGKLVAVIARERADEALRLIADCPPAQGPALIGEVVDTHHAKVVMRTALGGTRALAEPSGELLPRIC
jgi:hydrogenase expression/formation protein HypE